MSQDQFQALVLNQDEGKTTSQITTLPVTDLPQYDVQVAVDYSCLNYKDALAITGKGKIVRQFPFVPGIDFVGTVVESDNPEIQPGEKVILTGWGVGERYWGGLAQQARVKSEWLVPVPSPLTAKQVMAIGTAGFTAMLCVMALEEAGLKPEGGEVVVTGAAGGVGSIAVTLLAQLGYEVVAVSGRPETHDYLKKLGAKEIIGREVLTESKRPMDSERWQGGIDVVGGEMLAAVLKQTRYGGAVAACGLAGSIELSTTVFPFILRGVRLQGVESVYVPRERRIAAWDRLAQELPVELLEGDIATTISLSEVPQVCEQMVDGQVRGRVIVDLNQ